MYNSIYPLNIKPYKGEQKNSIDKDKGNKGGQGAPNRDGDSQNGEKYSGKPDLKKYQQSNLSENVSDSFKKSEATQYNEVASYSTNAKNIQSFSSQFQSINIAQILIDFKNTVSAIGAPDDVTEEMNGYFSLIEKQAVQQQPNVKVIKSNLKNASLVLDKYISESLGKPSNVVENWVDTLFLQKVDFSYDEGKINPEFQLKFPERKKQDVPEQTDVAEDTVIDNNIETTDDTEVINKDFSDGKQPLNTRQGVYLPDDNILKELYIKAKKYAIIKEPKKSLEYFQTALKRAVALDDDVAQSVIFYDVAKIFDKNDLCIPALKNYYRATKKTKDLKIKTKAHYGMAKIYGDFVKEEPAMEHYFAAMSFAGENDDMATQAFSLSNIANIHAVKSNVKGVRTYNNLSKNIALETKKSKVIGAVYAHGAENYTLAGEQRDALAYYKESTKEYSKISANKHMANNFEKAADLMLEMGKLKKAGNLYKKAYAQYERSKDEKSMKYIFEKMVEVSSLQKL